MKNKKICCLLIPSLQGNGAENVVLNIYEALTKYESFECHIIYIKDIVELEISNNINLHHVPLSSRKGLSSILFKRRHQAKQIESYILDNIGQPDLVLSNLTLMDKITKHLRFKKVYNIIHCNTSTEHLGDRKGLSKFIAKSKINNIYCHHDRVSVSNGVLKDLKINFKFKGRDFVIYNPINTPELLIKKNKPEELKINDDYFIHIGKFKDAKRHDRLIKAYEKSKTKTKLVLVGKGEKESQIKALVKELKLSEQVIFADFKSNPYPLLANAKGFILSSDYEGLPTVILEALALSVPVISTDCPSGPNEILPDISLCELNVDSLSDKIKEIDQNPESFRVTLNQKFTMEFAASQYAKLCEYCN